MKFNNKECTAQDVANIKKLYKQQSNNPKITKEYTDILEDTKTAIKNLNSCITSQEKLRTIMKLIQQENTSFMKNIIGVNEKGNNNSYYRGFLSFLSTDLWPGAGFPSKPVKNRHARVPCRRRTR